MAAGVCAAVPDVDVLAFRFGIPYSHMFGHRGFSHSVLFAAILATAVTLLLRQTTERQLMFRLWTVLFVVTLSHGVLDAMTNGGLGAAFLAPFSAERYFFGWRPLLVSPIGIGRFFSGRGQEVLRSEIVWVWIPSFLLMAGAWITLRVPLSRREEFTFPQDGAASN
jgi:inner membrane protein